MNLKSIMPRERTRLSAQEIRFSESEAGRAQAWVFFNSVQKSTYYIYMKILKNQRQTENQWLPGAGGGRGAWLPVSTRAPAG